ncbi:MAG TPA: 1-acyl-sn-glycerol-3-phosphate acyltransferase [Thermoanaerobaculia bacterium]
MRPRLDELAAFLRLILRVFFRSVEVVGAERLPLGRPMVLVANHVNGLIDPVLILGPLPVRPRLLAKSTLWKNPLVRPFAELAGAIPIYRHQDQVDTAQNEESFARCHEVLAEGGAIALFPEGKSHSEPALQPLKTGLARIVLGYERKRLSSPSPGANFDPKAPFGPLEILPTVETPRGASPAAAPFISSRNPRDAAGTPGEGDAPRGVSTVGDAPMGPGGEGSSVRIVPVGLTFDAKETFRSRALIQIGEPIDPSPEVALDREDNPAAVRSLTARVSRALEEVTLNYDSWEEARLIVRAAELYGRSAVALPGRRRLAESFPIQRAFLEGYEDLHQRFPDKVEALTEAVRTYDRLLAAFRLRDDQVAAAYPPSPVFRFVARTLLRLLIHLPLAIVGTILNWPTYHLIAFLAPRIARWIPDQTATYKLFGAVIFFPLTWIAEAILAARWLDTGWAAPLTLLLAPLTAWIALRFHETHTSFWREAWAYLLLRTRKKVAEELRSKRQEILNRVAELEDLWREEGASGRGTIVPIDDLL